MSCPTPVLKRGVAKPSPPKTWGSFALSVSSATKGKRMPEDDCIVVTYKLEDGIDAEEPFPRGVTDLVLWLRKNAEKLGHKLHVHAPASTTDEERREIQEAAGGVDVFQVPF